MSRRPKSVLVALATALVLASCGNERTPVQAVPALEDRLASVDRAVVDNDPTAIQKSVAALVGTTEEAVLNGRLDPKQGARITDAAEALLTQLSLMQTQEDDPGSDPESTNTASPPPEQVSPSPEEDEAEESQAEDAKEEKTKDKEGEHED